MAKEMVAIILSQESYQELLSRLDMVPSNNYKEAEALVRLVQEVRNNAVPVKELSESNGTEKQQKRDQGG